MANKINVGLIPAPELPEAICAKLAPGLAEAFNQHIDGDISWEIRVFRDPLAGAAENVDELIERAKVIKNTNKCDFTVCLTDLPIFSHKGVVLGDVNDREGIGQISIPAFGLPPVEKRVKETIIQVVGELYFRVNGELISNESSLDTHRGLLTRRFLLSPIRKITPSARVENSDVRFILRPKLYGRLKLLFGMTHANKPWSIIPSFKSVVAVAFATGSYGMVFPTLWRLSEGYEWSRFIVLTFAAVLAMIIWIMFAHNLWEKPSRKSHRRLRLLYNTTTLMTLTMAVGIYYVILFMLFLGVIAFLVPPEIFGEVVGIEEKNVNLWHFIQLGWLVTSVATVAGAIGSGLESEKKVRSIMYGYRQQQRYEEMAYYGDDDEQ